MIVTSIRNRFLQKPRAIWDMNYLATGRKLFEKDFTPLKVTYGYRTGFFGGKVIYNEGTPIIKSMIIRTQSNFNLEGIDIIPPFIVGSPGWVIFNKLPLIRMSLLKSEINQLKIKLSTEAIGALESQDLSSLKTIIFEVIDMFTSVRNKIEMVQPQQPLGFQHAKINGIEE